MSKKTPSSSSKPSASEEVSEENYTVIGKLPAEGFQSAEKYKVKTEIMEIRGECPFWSVGDKFDFDDALRVNETTTKGGGPSLKKSTIKSGLLSTYSICQLHPIMTSMSRGVGADELGLGSDPKVAYVACEAPSLGESPKGHGQVFFKVTREDGPAEKQKKGHQGQKKNHK